MLTAYILARRFGGPSTAGRFASIDGLRGYLAFFVFLHHSCIWYFFLKNGTWKLPPSNVYTNFGQCSVALFFMITSFLFFNKIVNERKTGTDWLRLFVSRVLRLTPLYLVAITLLLIIVAVLSNFQSNDSVSNIATATFKWLSFTILGVPDVNNVKNTSIIIAGVTWSLPYEWFFYLSLPLVALAAGSKLSPSVGIVGVIGVAGFIAQYSNPWHLLFFAGGIVVAMITRNKAFCRFAASMAASILLLVCFTVAVGFLPSTYGLAPLLLLILAFSLIAGGNTLFGIFTSKVSTTLGEMAYSIYLLHGLLLFVLFKFVVGFEQGKLIPASTHWTLIFALTPLLVTICFFTFRLIESPAMHSTNMVTRKIRLVLQRTGSGAISEEKN